MNLQYILSDTMSTFARYSRFERDATAQSMSQDLLIIGLTKQF
jgi:hypothetical protein